MKITQVGLVRTYQPVLATVLLTLWIGGCGAESPTAANNATSPAAAAPSARSAQSADLWEGESKGHVATGDPAQDDVALLVHLGRVLGAIKRANDHDKDPAMPNPFTPEVLAGYAAIEPIVSGFERTDLSLQPLLGEVASAETFAIIMDSNREQRTAQNAIVRQLMTLIGRADGIVTEVFPSTQASALAMSALYREAGELLRTGLSADGQVLDVNQYRHGLNLMDASLRLSVNKVSLCARSTEAADQLRHSGPAGQLLDQFYRDAEPGVDEPNAGNVFTVAGKLSDLGTSLPKDDAQICQ